MSQQTVAQHVLKRLCDGWNVRRIFAYPGDGILGFLSAFLSEENSVEFTQVRHEEIAAFAACAHAKFTGELGVCMATSGPGAIHLLNGLYDAKLDHQPVVAIVGQQKRMSLGGNYQQEVDLSNLFKDVATEFCQYCMAPEQATHLIDRAARIALVTKSPTCVIFPNDVQQAEFSEPPLEHGAVFSSASYASPSITPRKDDLRAAANILNSGSKVAMLVGQGVKDASDEVIETADLLGCGVAKALNGRAVLADDLPFVTGSIGLLGTRPSFKMMENCDTFLMVGSSFPYSEFLPKPGSVRGIQIDIDGRMLGIRYPMELNLVGDAKETLNQLIPLLERKSDRSWRQEIEAEVKRWWELMDARAEISAQPINPQLVFQELSPRLPDNCILTADSGSGTNWWARHLKLRQGMQAALSGTLATMCPGVPYALAAKFAYPDRCCIACVGDGAMQMLGMNALIDIAKYYHGWSNKQCIILVLNNQDLNQVTWEQRVMGGDPKLNASQVLPEVPYARYAELLGLKGIYCDDPAAIASGWDEALAADRPVVFEVVVDPEVPPLPPHITFEQAENFASALVREPDRVHLVSEAIKGKLREFAHN